MKSTCKVSFWKLSWGNIWCGLSSWVSLWFPSYFPLLWLFLFFFFLFNLSLSFVCYVNNWFIIHFHYVRTHLNFLWVCFFSLHLEVGIGHYFPKINDLVDWCFLIIHNLFHRLVAVTWIECVNWKVPWRDWLLEFKRFGNYIFKRTFRHATNQTLQCILLTCVLNW